MIHILENSSSLNPYNGFNKRKFHEKLAFYADWNFFRESMIFIREDLKLRK